MSKYTSRANEISARLQTLIDAFEIRGGDHGWFDYYVAPSEITGQYPDILLDTQALFFCDSPESPFYARAMKLNDRVHAVSDRPGDEFYHSDFTALRELLSKYIEYRSFLEEED